MTNRLQKCSQNRRGRQRPLLLPLGGVLITLVAMLGFAPLVSAHAEPERANPPIEGVVPDPPAVLEIWFSEDVQSDGTEIRVIGPGGEQVDLGDTEVDLQDPNRQRVTVSLQPDLGPGAYTVQWVTMSAADGDEARGGYLFRVGGVSADATPAATPVATPVTVIPAVTPTAIVGVQPVAEESEFDSRAFAISVLAGVLVAGLIFAFWRIVRPRNPMFRG